jgi:hypothetical protein
MRWVMIEHVEMIGASVFTHYTWELVEDVTL